MPNCDEFGFFNGIFGLEQANWGKYWKGIIPDGVIAGVGQEMAVSVGGGNLTVTVGTGEAMVDNHKAWITTPKDVTLTAASSSKKRIDAIVLKCTYGNNQASVIEATAIQGTAAASPSRPTIPNSITGGVCYLVLAYVKVEGSGAINSNNITDARYVYSLSMNKINTFTVSSGTTASVTPLNDREYRYSGSAGLTNLTINLPGSPHETFITGVCYSTGASSVTVTVKKGGNAYTTYKLVGDKLNKTNKRYELIIWWDSLDNVATSSNDSATGHYWIASKALGVAS